MKSILSLWTLSSLIPLILKRGKKIISPSQTAIHELMYKAHLAKEKAFQNPFSVLRK